MAPPASGPPPLRWAHAFVVALVGLAAVVGAVVVLVASQPRAESLPLPSASARPLQPQPTEPVVTGPTSAPLTATAAGPDAADTAGTVVVHVAGAVRRPGVVVLPSGSRVVDAVEAAGGEVPGTPLDSVNLARALVDGEQVRVGLPPDPAVQASTPAGSPAGAAGAVVDLNAADVAALDTLPGVGPVLAARIIAWRDQNGSFTTVDQLLEVSGIGPALLAELEGKVRV